MGKFILTNENLLAYACEELNSDKTRTNEDYQRTILNLLLNYKSIKPNENLLASLKPMLLEGKNPLREERTLKLLGLIDYSQLKADDYRFIEDYLLSTLLSMKSDPGYIIENRFIAAELLLNLPNLSKDSISTIKAYIDEDPFSNIAAPLQKIINKFTADFGLAAVSDYRAEENDSLGSKMSRLALQLDENTVDLNLLKELTLILLPLNELENIFEEGRYSGFSLTENEIPSLKELSMRELPQTVCDLDELEKARMNFVLYLTRALAIKGLDKEIKEFTKDALVSMGDATVRTYSQIISPDKLKYSKAETRMILKALNTLLKRHDFKVAISRYISSSGDFNTKMNLSEKAKAILSKPDCFTWLKEFLFARGVSYHLAS